MKKLCNNLKQNHTGFTLMEVMVSVTIFAIVITIGIGSLLTIYSTLRKTRADQQVIDSLSYVMDTMTRRIRTGTNYTGGGSSISFNDQVDDNGGGNLITYESGIDDNGNLRLYSTDNSDGIRYDFTPENLKINNFNIDISTPGDGQPLVQINISGQIINGRTESPLSIQAAVSQRSFIDTGAGNLKNTNTGVTSLIDGQVKGLAAKVELPTGNAPDGTDKAVSTDINPPKVNAPITGTAKVAPVRGQ